MSHQQHMTGYLYSFKVTLHQQKFLSNNNNNNNYNNYFFKLVANDTSGFPCGCSGLPQMVNGRRRYWWILLEWRWWYHQSLSLQHSQPVFGHSCLPWPTLSQSLVTSSKLGWAKQKKIQRRKLDNIELQFNFHVDVMVSIPYEQWQRRREMGRQRQSAICQTNAWFKKDQRTDDQLISFRLQAVRAHIVNPLLASARVKGDNPSVCESYRMSTCHRLSHESHLGHRSATESQDCIS